MELLSEILLGQKLKISYWEDTIVQKTTRSSEKEIEIEDESACDIYPQSGVKSNPSR